MSTDQVYMGRIHPAGVVVEAAYTPEGSSLATAACTADGTSCIEVWVKTASDRGTWALRCRWQVDALLTCMTWSSTKGGGLLATGSVTGDVYVWEPPGTSSSGGRVDGAADTAMADGGEEASSSAGGVWEYRLSAHLRCSTSPVKQLEFSPAQLGLSLAVLTADGRLRVYEPDRPLCPHEWLQQQCITVRSPGGCTCMCWRPFSAGTPPLLLLGTANGSEAWQQSASTLTWQRVCSLPSSTGAPVSCVHWAPVLGRQVELVAAGAGSVVDVYTLEQPEQQLQLYGAAASSGAPLGGDSCGSAVECILSGSLQHEAPVWRVQWDLLGHVLAVGTDKQQACLWRPNLGGQWQMTHMVQGVAEQEQELDGAHVAVGLD